ncbi:type III-B CRISPR module-associated protein Cmr5 [Gracilibacillus timonensis]|uniref:type III-B CRISPR module-associated protein Cmr5 n=1 Tax=Gracilibacillus timonensis TaxID=1816696 RepID=UPI0008250294|nr:type III-B CRISPR module-associated protein Cmr5 [Gracilibacillus timonensis]
MSNIKEVHNKRMQYAYDSVKGFIESHKEDGKEYRSLARSFPALIKANGLGAAVLYLKGREEKNAHHALYRRLNEWYGKKDGKQVARDFELYCKIPCMSSEEYRIFTREVLELSIWIKRFAEGMITSELQ